MNFLKKTSFYVAMIIMQPFFLNGVGKDAGSKAAEMLVEGIQEATTSLVGAAKDSTAVLKTTADAVNTTITTVAPLAKDASENFGRNFGTGTIVYLVECGKSTATTISAGAAKTYAAAKSGTMMIITAPATPYVVGSIVVIGGVSYVVYKIYRYNYPTLEDKTKKEERKLQLIDAQVKVQESKARLLAAQAKVEEAKIYLLMKQQEVATLSNKNMAHIAQPTA